jgi:hypothetical protein
MENASNTHNLNSEGVQYRTPSIPMRVVGGNSNLGEARVVFVGTNNHYDPGFQSRIASTLHVLPEPGDVVLTEGEPFGQLNSSWIPEMTRVDTGEVTMMGWENQGLYNSAGTIVRDLQNNQLNLAMLSSMGLGQLARPLIDGLKHKIDRGKSDFDRVVLHERTGAMKRSVMSVLGNRLQKGGTAFVYAGSAHLTGAELGGMGGIKHIVLGV